MNRRTCQWPFTECERARSWTVDSSFGPLDLCGWHARDVRAAQRAAEDERAMSAERALSASTERAMSAERRAVIDDVERFLQETRTQT
jgi:hypothetical protein